ncbi:short chain dehydrogenase [Enteractinococcus helveticum]|uniref:Short chain dehydrogenase n=1 Tax=Enteractinococcus helveticum TaxID=1837282 RepID=A0A1B7M2B3_9MICC|nr:short chain dehydrogenase [Enteractinococcus helveticum]OAV62700.1 short chain dehydrogenase [Enteractinococcus helveticum]
MKILSIGAHGTAGRAITEHLASRGHDMITVGRTRGDIQADVSDLNQLQDMWQQAGTVDAVVYAAGEVRYAEFQALSSADFESAWQQKALAQINLVRTGLDHIAPRGSFTLMSGIPSRDPVVSGVAAATVNGAVDAFVRAAAIEMAPIRINAVSPSVFTESLDTFGDFFPGFIPVDLADVARGFQKSVEGAATGQTILP